MDRSSSICRYIDHDLSADGLSVCPRRVNHCKTSSNLQQLSSRAFTTGTYVCLVSGTLIAAVSNENQKTPRTVLTSTSADPKPKPRQRPVCPCMKAQNREPFLYKTHRVQHEMPHGEGQPRIPPPSLGLARDAWSTVK